MSTVQLPKLLFHQMLQASEFTARILKSVHHVVNLDLSDVHFADGFLQRRQKLATKSLRSPKGTTCRLVELERVEFSAGCLRINNAHLRCLELT